MTTVHITESNFSKIALKNIRDINADIAQVCRRVYESRNVGMYLNHQEIRFIECKRLLLENTEECIQRHVQRIEAENMNKKQKKNQSAKYSPYVFVSDTPPKYHFERECKFLSKDYLNFLVPPEIEARGQSEIQKFRDFATANKQLVLDNKVYAFIHRLKTQFRLQNDVSQVTFTNTGVRALDLEDGIDITREIDSVLNEIDSLGRTESGADTLKKFRYMDHWKRDLAQDNDGVIQLLNMKSRLVDLIVKFHLQNNSMKGFSFDEGLLELVGFQSCGSCGKKFDL